MRGEVAGGGIINPMKKYILMGGVFAFVLSGLPVVVLAHAEEGSGNSSVQVTSVTSERVSDDDSDDDNDTSTTMSPSAEGVREAAKQQAEQAREMSKERFELQRENVTTAAFSLDQLKQMMKERKHELDDEEASTTPRFKDVMKNSNEVRRAVHALLASKELLGGIGQQVSEIARNMNDSIATTTSAEVKIKSRGFVARFFFGGDKNSAKFISREVERNGENIAKLTELLNSANLPAEVKAVMETQLTAMQEQQTRLQDVASSQAKLWGLFSWRF